MTKVSFITILLASCMAHALTSGPAMPEYNDFEPVDATDLVNLPTGDFSYTVPIMTVPGPGLEFPIVLGYHSGINLEQEASWVGLGWNLQAGAITRQVNNIPDDYRGDPIKETVKSSVIYGWMASIGYNSVTVGISCDNTNGYGGMVGLNYSVGGAVAQVSSGWNGVYDGVNSSISARVGDDGLRAGLTVGYSSGVGNYAGAGVSVSMESQGSRPGSGTTSMSMGNLGVSISQKGGYSSSAGTGISVSMSSSISGAMHSNSTVIPLSIATPIGYFSFSWGEWSKWIESIETNSFYGFLYQDKDNMGCLATGSAPNCSNWNLNTPIPDLTQPGGVSSKTEKVYRKQELNQAGANFSGEARLMATSQDHYTVASQGLSGSFSPYRKEDGDYLSFLDAAQKFDTWSCADIITSIITALTGEKCGMQKQVNRTQVLEENRNLLFKTDAGKLPETDIYWRFQDDAGGAEYTNPSNRDATAEVSVQSKRVKPFFKSGKIIGFELTKEDGVTYTYSLPVYNHYELKTGRSGDLAVTTTTTQEMKSKYAYAWLLTGIKNPDHVSIVGGNCATDLAACVPKNGDIGGWVRFEYGLQNSPGTAIYQKWRTPFIGKVGSAPAPTPVEINNYGYSNSYFGGYTKEGIPMKTERSSAEGIKEIYYLTSIETPTHRADLTISARQDGVGADLQSGSVSVASDQITLASDSLATVVKQAISTAISPSIIYTMAAYVNPSFRIETNLQVGTSVQLNGYIRKFYEITTPNEEITNLRGYPVSGNPYYWGLYAGGAPPSYTNVSKTATVTTFGGKNVIEFQIQDIIAKSYTTTQSGVPNPSPFNYPVVPEGLKIQILSQPNSELKKLDKIVLKNKILNKEIGAAEFTFDYSLCGNTPNSDAANHGKLTLTKIRVGGASNGPFSPYYQFTYADNPSFQQTWHPYDGGFKWDRWGYYCSTCNSANHESSGDDAKAWSLTKVALPSGGSINVSYESDRYDFVGSWDAANQKQVFNTLFPLTSPPSGNRQMLVSSGNFVSFSTVSDYQGPTLKAIPPLPGILGNITAELSYTGTLTKAFPTGNSKFFVDMPILQASDCYIISGLKRDNMSNNPPHYLELSGVSGSASLNLALSLKGNCIDPRMTIFEANLDGNGKVILPPITYIGYHSTYTHKANFTSDQENLLGKGGGVRVTGITVNEPFGKPGGTDNSVSYSYSQGVTPNMPSYYTTNALTSLYPANQGLEFIVGSPNVTYKRVVASFGGTNASTHYHFITAMDLPVTLTTPTTVIPSSLFSVEVRDLSALWGSLWKKQDFNGNSLVMEQKSTWAYNADFNGNATHTIQEAPLNGSQAPAEALTVNHVKDANNKPYVFMPFTSASPAKDLFGSAPQPSWSTYFGLEQSVYSLRYFSQDCTNDFSDFDEFQACTDTKQRSTQIVMKRFMPSQFGSLVKRDGLQSTSWSYYHDFLTGAPLKNRIENSDGSILVKQTLPAYADYEPMLIDHQFSQKKGEISYHHAGGVAFTSDSVDSKVVAASYTKWDRVGGTTVVSGGINYYANPQAFRPVESLVWNNSLSGFKLPTPTCSYGRSGSTINYGDFTCNPGTSANWVPWLSQVRNLRMDEYGHVTETMDARNVSSAGLYAYGSSLPVAIGANARYDDLFYEGFEVEPEMKCKFTGGNCKTATPGAYTNFQTLDKYTRTGLKSMQVKNTASKDVCFQMNPLTASKAYLASVWYYDETAGATTSDVNATRPGITFGQPGVCQVELFPNGKNAQTPPSMGQPGYIERATGSRKWKKIEVQLNPCGGAYDPSQVTVCLSASAGNIGLPVTYDEMRVQPVDAQMETFSYNAMGKMISKSDANGIVTYYEYDALGNMTGIRNDDGTLLSERGKQYGKH